MPTVSVILPVHNRESLVGRAIASVRAQTFEDWELIVVDDASTDATAEVVERAASIDPRIQLLRHEKNRGGNAARNTGLHASHGPWIALQDSDDEWLPRKLEAQMALVHDAEEHGKAMPGVVSCWYFEQDSSGQQRRVEPRIDGDAYVHLLRQFFGTSATLLIRRAVFDRVGEFNADMFSCQEYEFLLRAAEEFEFAIVPEELAITHAHSGRRAAGNPQGYRMLCDRYAEEIRANWGRSTVAARRTFVGTLYRNAGHPAAAAGQYAKALAEWPLAVGALVRLAALPLYIPKAWNPTYRMDGGGGG
ncbi:glycosyltransferase family 2 protein [bacterium]|nr:glycosyltransferase family 2 protein [bacterium]